MIRKILLVFFLMFGLATISAAAEETLAQRCLLAYQETGNCPPNICRFVCLGGRFYEGCPLTCQPKSCLEISAKDCPQQECQVIPGCEEKKDICYPPTAVGLSDCGQVSYSGKETCCEGLVKRCGVEFFDGSCDMIGKNTWASAPSCLPCGNGICNQFENRCNCPEDCGKKTEATPLESTPFNQDKALRIR